MTQVPTSVRPRREVVSFVRRSARMNPSQQRAWDLYSDHYLIDVERDLAATSIAAQPPLDWDATFGRKADLVMEIGVGNGEALCAAAVAEPHRNFVGLEVFVPSTASAVGKLGAASVDNAKVLMADGVAALTHLVAPASLSEIRIFFPDPWHKARHHKRRLITDDFVALVAQRLQPGGVLRLATDWSDYAEWSRDILEGSSLVGDPAGWSPRFAGRPLTKYEQRGLDAGRRIYDLTYRLPR